jgi:hypothetical protein
MLETTLIDSLPYSTRLRAALRADPGDLSLLVDESPSDWRDLLVALQAIHELHTAPLHELGGTEWLQHDPAVAAIKAALEHDVLLALTFEPAGEPPPTCGKDAVGAMRAIAARDLVPPVYDWLARDADLAELVEFLAVEGGPDSGFDDLVAVCQVGLDGLPKLALAVNYWDEMGRGELDDVHTKLHGDLGAALALRAPGPEDTPIEALERSALTGVLATNRAFQPELVGALGLLELQAGPRCRRVVTGLRRVGAPVGALPFYEEHARADPVHGRDWLERAVGPLADRFPEWGERIVAGATWRAAVNRRLFDALHRRFGPGADTPR